MDKTQYKQLRRLMRDNGHYALRGFNGEIRRIMERIRGDVIGKDKLAERAEVVAYCKREGLEYNFRQIQ
ncbi:hypothetical protein CWO84_10170 [Methylomonas sp. Kb3]|uniref:hypothetical protein n=1 Tax=Methylomonas sp. Kb3 TaxID=1611544 RepID=UPI000C32E470|nr:hypothetical protein [Methylomonas sp. Kb3]PKD40493.1 hypothetical protein CWO84_10170 [Methylomonas sp. Kb3]